MNNNRLGQLYAVGLGTGDSELLTLKAVRLIKQADIVALPEKSKGKADSFAWQIISGAIPLEQLSGERCFLHFPMTRNAALNVPAWQQAAQTILSFLQAGKNVVFVTEGDPSVFSTWAYVQQELALIAPQIEPIVVPGVTSITAVPAATKIPLAEGQERFCVVPATYGIECLEYLVDEFDTIMLIKAGRVIDSLTAKLKTLGLLECATYVSHASTEQEEIYACLEDVPAENRYFSMVQLSIRSRQGVLRGTSTAVA
ncbi:precorrin-2 C(20)-methyltransferase [Vibrio panuliri]|uniref:Precorrin-2 C(20)-methyltransferase n=1 Tax=Vibrio panuliri TaxID=1381081 RepID=A0A1Q9HJG5_9VIBR|nr:precorrin-2 C(20)-methyltransferase [Vibrio panuliri]KAB1454019.1 precorrin-2 C(20)-methyltransferase [Vibrio panuliri]OLQ84433.1 precorrin-2 C(20)-methyltransferase [Vibrio panuliri]OLQ90441.1 precorrin-2 C(20)-methyltransferase [Vibrio panuliri]